MPFYNYTDYQAVIKTAKILRKIFTFFRFFPCEFVEFTLTRGRKKTGRHGADEAPLQVGRPSSPHEVEEMAMKAGVVVELGMEGSGQAVALTDGNDATVDPGEDVDSGRQRLGDVGCADEGHGHVGSYAVDGSHCVEAAQLSTVSIAPHAYVHGAEIAF